MALGAVITAVSAAGIVMQAEIMVGSVGLGVGVMLIVHGLFGECVVFLQQQRTAKQRLERQAQQQHRHRQMPRPTEEQKIIRFESDDENDD